MADAKTVDNLGADVHQRFIDDTRLLNDEELQKIYQTPSIAKRAEVLKTAPKFSEIDLLWGAQEKETSPFAEPPNFVLTTDVFTHLLIPSVGNGNDIIQKLESLKQEKESDVERQRKALLNFANNYQKLNKDLEYIKRKQEEFHRG